MNDKQLSKAVNSLVRGIRKDLALKEPVRVLSSNKARCRKCNDMVESKTVHDFKRCRCGAMFVDGGLEYLRRGGELEHIEELSEYIVQ